MHSRGCDARILINDEGAVEGRSGAGRAGIGNVCARVAGAMLWFPQLLRSRRVAGASGVVGSANSSAILGGGHWQQRGMGNEWRRKQDHYAKAAKRDGLRSRASFKLQQMNEKVKLLRPGDPRSCHQPPTQHPRPDVLDQARQAFRMMQATGCIIASFVVFYYHTGLLFSPCVVDVL